MPDNDLDYLQRRAETELELAQRSESPDVKAAHYGLAEAYLERMDALRGSAALDSGASDGEAAAQAEATSAGFPEGRETKSDDGAVK